MTPAPTEKLVGAVEAGGTKIVCAVGTGPDDIREEIRFPTSDPEETLRRIIDYFTDWQRRNVQNISAIGYGTFGPCEPSRDSPRFGMIGQTPKTGWSNADVAGPLRSALGVPIGFDTDVNAAALGEHLWGAARDVGTFAYLTIGTGIGAGLVVNGQLLHGAMHPEIGHMAIPRDPMDTFAGTCPFHEDCFEGLASGPAISARWHVASAELHSDHPAWRLEAGYLGQACRALICTISAQRIVLGGGVMEQVHLFPSIRKMTVAYLNGYLPDVAAGIEGLIVGPALGNRSGIVGAIALAQRELQ